MTSLDMKPSPSRPSIPSSSSLKRSYEDAQRNWQQSPYHPPTPPMSHGSGAPGGFHEGDHEMPEYMNEDGSRKVVKKRKLERLQRSLAVDEEIPEATVPKDALLPSTSISPRPLPSPRPEHEGPDYARMNNVLHTAHVLRHHASPASPAASTSATHAWSPPLVETARAPAAEADNAKPQYGETNRLLGLLALERSRRHGIQQSEPDSDEENEDTGGRGGANPPDEDDGSVEEDDPSVIWDSDMEL